jgi:KaiC/GvpD/RAD55 family RecA-like ATPase
MLFVGWPQEGFLARGVGGKITVMLCMISAATCCGGLALVCCCDMTMENCPLCRGTGWRLEARTSGPPGKVATACDCGMEQRANRVMERARIPKRYEHCDFESYVPDLADGKTYFPQHVQSMKQAKMLAQGFVRDYPGSAEKGLLLMGPSGVGKTTMGVACMMAALQRGETATYYLFDEGLATLLARSAMLGMDLRPHLDSGRLVLTQIDPAELSPGEFAAIVRRAIEERGSTFIAVDSLNAYLHAMPGEDYLILQMHELLSYLNQKGVTTLLVLGQHGVIGEVRSDVDLSYLSDAILLFRFFEAQGQIRTALSVVKSRVNAHERTIRELRLSDEGLQVGEPLRDFEGVLSGLPAYHGKVAMLTRGSGREAE